MNDRARLAIITVAALLTAALTARLGIWQLDRAAQKLAMQAQIDARAALAPLDGADLAREASQALSQHRRAVRLVGRWSAAHTVFLDNRQMASGQPGFHVLTPLVLDSGQAVLVQRGWAPRDVQDRARLPEVATPAGEVVVSGRIAPPPPRLFEFDGAASGPIRQNLDIENFSRETGLRLLPLSVQQLSADPASVAGDRLLRNWPAPATGVAKHHGYAFQWFGLSALVLILYVWFQFIQPRRVGRR